MSTITSLTSPKAAQRAKLRINPNIPTMIESMIYDSNLAPILAFF